MRAPAFIVAILMTASGQIVQASSPCPTGAAWPPPFRLDFEVKATRGFIGLNGQNTLSLARDAESYTLVAETSAGAWFSARQSSRGLIGATGLAPAEYLERNGKKAQTTTQLDWKSERVTFSASDDLVATRPLMQDKLSLLLQLGWTLRARGGGVIELPVVGARHAHSYRFEARGTETIDTPAGRFQTRKFERPMDADDERLEVWLAPSLCGLPVRVRFTDRRGQVIANELKSVRF